MADRETEGRSLVEVHNGLHATRGADAGAEPGAKPGAELRRLLGVWDAARRVLHPRHWLAFALHEALQVR
jgi:hypothetical protein